MSWNLKQRSLIYVLNNFYSFFFWYINYKQIKSIKLFMISKMHVKLYHWIQSSPVYPFQSIFWRLSYFCLFDLSICTTLFHMVWVRLDFILGTHYSCIWGFQCLYSFPEKLIFRNLSVLAHNAVWRQIEFPRWGRPSSDLGDLQQQRPHMHPIFHKHERDHSLDTVS